MGRIDNNSLSVIVPAFNEENYLKPTVEMVSGVAKKQFDDYEIIIFNDGSVDKTGQIANKLGNQYNHVRVVHHKSPICLGGIYKEGIKLAKMNYVILVNGKNDIVSSELEKILSLKGKADMIVPYTTNRGQRSFNRRTLSIIFVYFLNFIFNLDLRYYNHYVLHRREIISIINIYTDSYAFQAEALIKLIKLGYSYIQVGVADNFDNDVATKAFRLKNIIGISLFFIKIIYEIYFTRRYILKDKGR
ncbi:MAG: glycosyltransferase family 2 protein [Candidatus Omnitrophica bacterium]|nr:glycosyltransferase family 2 protein [Candidatus Omnitrophota bacterium]MCF7876736.1 glycosyltransferase family 2 protein [Candidatus Omnitrophota bacterium]MCF7891469.1 glycosyltransferase family 2 protein [Candidatus Omnitrophota bacterium]MCF7895405.1 glycosyltransferase family 2 protein [Candidatus Omnitrophota bacterium]MCF7897159.1 glycosyltransferase family 2 protein [Candidatus Omnitrophota bacterium]